MLKEKISLKFNENVDLASQKDKNFQKIENINKKISVLKINLKIRLM